MPTTADDERPTPRDGGSASASVLDGRAPTGRDPGLETASAADSSIFLGAPVFSAPRPVGNDDPTRTQTRAPDSAAAPPSTSSAAVERLPAPLQYRDPERYQVVAEHGRGGLGRVYRARDRELGRDVALKELLHRGTSSELRFFREALITARLEHPSIVPVHEAGRWPDGTPFYAMKLVAGRPLKEVLEECKTLDDRLALLPNVIAVADAIAYAHDRKIIHRDLKPSNVMVGEFGETVVIDWGLAKVIDGDDDVVGSHDEPARRSPAGDGVTVAGSVLGTPAFMAPEQARGEPVDERADVYAIGAILEVLLTGSRPTPRSRNERPRVRGYDDLAAIAAKCTEARPADRYRTARDLAADLRLYVGGARVHAQRYSLARLLWLWVRRHRTRAIAALAAIVACLVTGTVAFFSILAERDRAEHNRRLAEASSQRSEAERLHAVESLANLTLARDPTAAYGLIQELPDLPATQLLRSRAIAGGVAERIIPFKGKAIYNITPLSAEKAVVITDDRHLSGVDLQTGDKRLLAEGTTRPIRLVTSGETVFYTAHAENAGISLVEQTFAGPAHVVATVETLPREIVLGQHGHYWLDPQSRLYEHSAADGRVVLVAENVSQVGARDADGVWCTSDGGLFAKADSAPRKIGACAPSVRFLWAGSYLVFGSAPNEVSLLGPGNQIEGTAKVRDTPQPDRDYNVASSGLLTFVDSSGHGGYVVSGQGLHTLRNEFDRPPLTVGAGGRFASWSLGDGRIFIIDVVEGTQWIQQAHDSGDVLAVTTDSGLIATSALGAIRVWSPPAHRVSLLARGATGVWRVSLNPQQTQAVMNSNSQTAQLLTLGAQSATLDTLHRHDAAVGSTAWCGASACSGGWDSTLRCTDPNAGTEVIKHVPSMVRWLTPGIGRCYMSLADGSVWASDGAAPLYSHASEAYLIAYDPSDGLLASLDISGTLLVFDTRTSTIVARREHVGSLSHLSWEGPSLWTASDGEIRRWRRSGAELVIEEAYAPPEGALQLAVSPDFLAADVGPVLWIRNRHDGRVAELDFHAGITSLTLSADSQELAVATDTGEVHLLSPSTVGARASFMVAKNVKYMFFVAERLLAFAFDGTVYAIPSVR